MRIFYTIFLVLSLSHKGLSDTGQPALWKISDSDTSIYLFGSLHSLDEDTVWFTKSLERVLHEADAIYLEIDSAKTDNKRTLSAIKKFGFLKGSDRLRNHLPEFEFQKLSRFLKNQKTHIAVYNQLRPWLAAVTLYGDQFGKTGWKTQFGVEQTLANFSENNGIPIRSLETTQQQIYAFSKLTPKDEQQFFSHTLKDAINAQDLSERILNAWLQPDLIALDLLLNSRFRSSPQLAQQVLFIRNKKWSIKLKRLLGTSGIFFVAVGVGHLVGENSLLDELASAGLLVKRVQ